MHIQPIVHCFLRIHYLEHKTSDWVRKKISFLVGPRELWRDGNLHDSGMSHATTAPPKPFFIRGTLDGGRRRGQQRK